MATIFDNIKNLFGSKKEEKQILRKEAPVVYYNSVNTSYQQKTRYDQLSEEGYSENIRRLPFVSRVSGSLGSFEDTGSFIEGRDEVLLAFKELQEARKAQDETRYNRTLEKFAPQLTIVGKIKAINNARNRLIRKRNEIRKNPRVPQERKDLLITRINGKIEELTVTGNRVMREANVI